MTNIFHVSDILSTYYGTNIWEVIGYIVRGKRAITNFCRAADAGHALPPSHFFAYQKEKGKQRKKERV